MQEFLLQNIRKRTTAHTDTYIVQSGQQYFFVFVHNGWTKFKTNYESHRYQRDISTDAKNVKNEGKWPRYKYQNFKMAQVFAATNTTVTWGNARTNKSYIESWLGVTWSTGENWNFWKYKFLNFGFFFFRYSLDDRTYKNSGIKIHINVISYQ